MLTANYVGDCQIEIRQQDAEPVQPWQVQIEVAHTGIILPVDDGWVAR